VFGAQVTPLPWGHYSLPLSPRVRPQEPTQVRIPPPAPVTPCGPICLSQLFLRVGDNAQAPANCAGRHTGVKSSEHMVHVATGTARRTVVELGPGAPGNREGDSKRRPHSSSRKGLQQDLSSRAKTPIPGSRLWKEAGHSKRPPWPCQAGSCTPNRSQTPPLGRLGKACSHQHGQPHVPKGRRASQQGHWAAQKHPSRGRLGGSVGLASAFSSGHDRRVPGSSPTSGSLLSGGSASPSDPSPLMLSVSHSLSQINK